MRFMTAATPSALDSRRGSGPRRLRGRRLDSGDSALNILYGAALCDGLRGALLCGVGHASGMQAGRAGDMPRAGDGDGRHQPPLPTRARRDAITRHIGFSRNSASKGMAGGQPVLRLKTSEIHDDLSDTPQLMMALGGFTTETASWKVSTSLAAAASRSRGEPAGASR